MRSILSVPFAAVLALPLCAQGGKVLTVDDYGSWNQPATGFIAIGR